MSSTSPTPLATSSHFNTPPPKLHVVRNPASRVRQAVRDNNVSLLQRLQHKTDLRNTDGNRLTSLSWAAMEGNIEVFEWLLLDYGHDDQELSRDSDNNTILHLLAAVPSRSLSPHTQILNSSSSFPPRPNPRPLAEQSAISLRMTHLYVELFPFLIDWSNTGGKTALHVAAQAGNAPFINFLCDLGADLDLTDLQGNTPLHYAAAWGYLDTIKVLLERGCTFSSRNFEGFTASEFAYSDRVQNALQTMARELFEERRHRRKEAKDRQDARENHRARSGSVSTSASMGSGVVSYSNNPAKLLDIYQTNPPASQPSHPNEHSNLSLMSHGGSDQTSLLSGPFSSRPATSGVLSKRPSASRLGASPPLMMPEPAPSTPQLGQLLQQSYNRSPVPFPTHPAMSTSSVAIRPSASTDSGAMADKADTIVDGRSEGVSIRKENSAHEW
ncbi:hypothetical protein I305_00884 [Cryptococcus gattii E566]|uniref:Uncharacterized protein n=2 Tax=Cryptococcus gattii TaxID=37769 RepID=E6R3L7_CRYGW|nr:uncharacterized protein CGB_C5390C [Cryptococcus gattii WM276]ADV21106.1 hypothetical protein CNBC3680 [Cryptococcus gattii WM276]KIR82034.1 hypothetical protein I306_00905 [Cryptococcus gattii EJB2]KIY36835.1 hypothetical protein I305_00884 [Cryptococcus gattii E566]KJE04045.1 hypothetical protein I311_02176 [Cryptococcus gattii NT-10]